MPDPLSMVSGKGSIVPASLVNPQAQAQIIKTQAVADAIGTRKSLNTANGQIQSSIKSSNTGSTVSGATTGATTYATKDVTRTDALGKTDENDQPDKDKGLSGDQDPFASKASLKEAAETFREYLNSLPSDLKFNIDEDTDRLILKIVNPVTKEVVKQYPPDEFLSMVKSLKEMTNNLADNGVILDTRS